MKFLLKFYLKLTFLLNWLQIKNIFFGVRQFSIKLRENVVGGLLFDI